MSQKRLSKERIHHEAMKKGGVSFFENLYEMRISQRSSKKVEPALLHGFMVYPLLASAFD